MMNKMIILNVNGIKDWYVFPANVADKFVELNQEVVELGALKEVEPGKVALEDLPDDIQEEVKETLKFYDRTYVTYHDGRFVEMPAVGVSASYSKDYFSCGQYNADDVYTPEERRQHRIEASNYSFELERE